MAEATIMSSRITCLLLGVLLVAWPSGPAEAQIGGLLKKKAKEAAQAPVKQEEAKQQADDAAARALASPDVVPITKESTARFRKALRVEAQLRGEFVTFLASLKTQEQYAACKSEVMMSPEGQKASMGMLALGDKATPAEMQKAMLKANADVEALTTRQCGGDPSQWTQGRRVDRLREIEGEASDAFAPPRTEPSPGGSPDARRSGPSAPSADEAQADAHPNRRQYAITKERWIPFCNASSTAQTAKANGKYATVKGEGSGVYVYASDEAAFMASSCADVMSDIEKASVSVGRSKLP
jgi:hypothetical protein